MRYLALASDYDGTLAHHGVVDAPTAAALERLVASGRKLILVTGRELPELLSIFPQIGLFERVVAENGALLYRPGEGEEQVLAEPPPEKFVAELKRRGVGPMSVGRAIVATWEPHETAVLETIRDLGLELQVIFNKGAVMILPAGVTKATGLAAALAELKLSPHNVVGVGDAENDHALLTHCERSAAVANALPTLKEHADICTVHDHGAGVAELIEQMLADDLARYARSVTRHNIRLGALSDGREMRVRPYDTRIMIAGPEASGKSRVAASIFARLAAARYQFCVIDTEGDYPMVSGAVVLGTKQGSPSLDEVLDNLRMPEHNVVVSLVGLRREDRRSFFTALCERLRALRNRFARPHWLLLDDASDLLPPAESSAALSELPADSVLLVTTKLRSILKPVLAAIDSVVAVGRGREATFAEFAAAVGSTPPPSVESGIESDEVLIWDDFTQPAKRLRIEPHKEEERAQRRKVIEGDLGPDRSFYFRGPDAKLKLRAQNVSMFLQLADGVDDVTWMHHLQQGDYSRWFHDVIRDSVLRSEIARVEAMNNLTADESRSLVRGAIKKHYGLGENR